MEAFLDSTAGKIIYIVLFLVFCVIMEWRSRVLKARLDAAINGLNESSQQIRNALRK
jgi:hypothetical protein